VPNLRPVPQEPYEEGAAPHGDALFDAFHQRLRLDPTQVARCPPGPCPSTEPLCLTVRLALDTACRAWARYAAEGAVLQVTSTRAAVPLDAGSCPLCGQPRACRLQLVPTLLSRLIPKYSAHALSASAGVADCPPHRVPVPLQSRGSADAAARAGFPGLLRLRLF
jgi:hypothetical protein